MAAGVHCELCRQSVSRRVVSLMLRMGKTSIFGAATAKAGSRFVNRACSIFWELQVERNQEGNSSEQPTCYSK